MTDPIHTLAVQTLETRATGYGLQLRVWNPRSASAGTIPLPAVTIIHDNLIQLRDAIDAALNTNEGS